MPEFSRRRFLAVCSTVAVGTSVAVNIPTAWLPAQIRTSAACEYLLRAYRAYIAGRSMADHPTVAFAGRELVEAYEGELDREMKFCSTDPSYRFAILFKGVPLVVRGRGWMVSFA